MNDKPWPLCIPHTPTPEEVEAYQAIIDKVMAGTFETRPLSGKERDRMKRLQAEPVSVSIMRPAADIFEIRMRCRGCGAKDVFDHTAPQPWIDRKNRFTELHKDHKLESRQ